MPIKIYGNKEYEENPKNHLRDFEKWDKNYSRDVAKKKWF